jgi:4-hydroxybenzoate polyprenyltransferase
MWPTILSLDAPAVAVLWQGLIARSASVGSGAPERIVLGASVWLAYSADRWIEGWRIEPGRILTHRHRFYQNGRWPILSVWIVVLAMDVFEAIRGLSSAEFRAGVLVLLGVTAYLLSHQLVHRKKRWRAPKEACVAFLLGAGAAAFAASRPGADLRGMALPLALFALLCFSNCALISVWENEVDRSHGQTSLALQFARTKALSRALPWVICALSAVLWALALPQAREAAACAAASGMLLGLVELAERRTGRVAARVLADVALMTPVLGLLFGWAP